MNTPHCLKLIFSITALCLSSCTSSNPIQPILKPLKFEQSEGLETSTYQEVIRFYQDVTKHIPNTSFEPIGTTDSGYPLHVFSYVKNNDSSNLNILINNGIHPGESDGIDACMLLLKDIINGEFTLPDNINLYIIPTYNIGGMLNRNSTTRANQNGPKAYGFRGNARNFDLNRDFMKMDTNNMKTFAEIFHDIHPDVYVETHVSNGADYQYTLTHLLTQHNRLGHNLGEYLESEFKIKLEQNLNKIEHIITPYVNMFGRTPDEGFSQFVDYPRYSTGYTSLWNTLGLMIETHMLKPYKNRVLSTKEMLTSITDIASEDATKIRLARKLSALRYAKDEYYKFKYTIDSTRFETLNFKGYDGEWIESKITGKPRLLYNQNKPFTKPVKYYNQFKAQDSIKIADYYLIKKSWNRTIHNLDINEIEYNSLTKDTLISVEAYRLEDFKTYTSAYEGHYPHYDTKVMTSTVLIEAKAGDILVPVRQPGMKYIIEALEPEMKDSFFNWNYYDTILQQKEGFSDYVFEEYAAHFLEANPELKIEFEAMKVRDPEFNKNAYAQLNWIYKRSPLYEKSHLTYPVYRVIN